MGYYLDNSAVMSIGGSEFFIEVEGIIQVRRFMLYVLDYVSQNGL